ncbi:hypothetical protein JT359_08295 [Candidatus Poribacteria bacterium]|nr:hypothetical protein [Candidatus Poribacteria bacterium]
MSKAFKTTLAVFIIFLVLFLAILLYVIQRYTQYGSIPDTMEMVDFQGILLAVLSTTLLSLITIVLSFLLARAWIREQPEYAEGILKFTLIITLCFIIVLGGLSGGVIILRTLWTIGYF